MEATPFLVREDKRDKVDYKWGKEKCSCHRGVKWYESHKNLEHDFALRMNEYVKRHCELKYSRSGKVRIETSVKAYLEGDRDIVDIFNTVFD